MNKPACGKRSGKELDEQRNKKGNIQCEDGATEKNSAVTRPKLDAPFHQAKAKCHDGDYPQKIGAYQRTDRMIEMADMVETCICPESHHQVFSPYRVDLWNYEYLGQAPRCQCGRNKKNGADIRSPTRA